MDNEESESQGLSALSLGMVFVPFSSSAARVVLVTAMADIDTDHAVSGHGVVRGMIRGGNGP